MRIYEVQLELDDRFDDRRTMFRAKAAGDATDYAEYIALEDKIVSIILDAISLVDSSEIAIFYQECFDDKSELYGEFTSDGLVTEDIFGKRSFSKVDEIKQVLRYLCRDLGFVTLGQIGKILIIPLERLNFLICLPDDIAFAKQDVVRINKQVREEELAIYGIEKVALP